jgi:hypothetical protein
LRHSGSMSGRRSHCVMSEQRFHNFSDPKHHSLGDAGEAFGDTVSVLIFKGAFDAPSPIRNRVRCCATSRGRANLGRGPGLSFLPTRKRLGLSGPLLLRELPTMHGERVRHLLVLWDQPAPRLCTPAARLLAALPRRVGRWRRDQILGRFKPPPDLPSPCRMAIFRTWSGSGRCSALAASTVRASKRRAPLPSSGSPASLLSGQAGRPRPAPWSGSHKRDAALGSA